MQHRGLRHGKGVHPRGILERLFERLRGRDQKLVRPGGDLPLLLLSYPRGASDAVQEIESAYTRTWLRLKPETRAIYGGVLESLPGIVVVLLRPRNSCTCLGHSHPRGTESALTRRLAGDLGEPVGEIDLASEAIREWQPEPVSSLAAGGPRLASIHFQAALLTVLLHELDHLVFPEREEREIRTQSNRFYSEVMRELVAEESGAEYGMVSPPPRP